MFEALFILTTIDAGTRIGRFCCRKSLGKMHPATGHSRTGGPARFSAPRLIVVGWAYFINANSFGAIWPMFGIANQMLAVIALAIVSAYLVNVGKAISVGDGLSAGVVMTTTSTAAMEILAG